MNRSLRLVPTLSLSLLWGLAAPSHAQDAEAPATLLDVLEEQRDLRTLFQLVEVADLQGALGDPEADPVTFFAPSEAGLRKLGFMFLRGITSRGSEDELADLLRAHMVKGRLAAAAVAEAEGPFTSLAGGPIPVGRKDGEVLVDGHKVIATYSAANGIIHVIDGPIQPSAETYDPKSPGVLVDFKQAHAVGGWQQVHDSVMGGRSDGSMKRGGEDFGRFKGTTSLANNGGFASLVTSLSAGRLKDADGVTLRVRGDGRTYRFALRKQNTPSGGTFWCEFDTTKDKWIEVTIPFPDFERNFMGRTLPGKIAGAEVRGLGFYIYDKKAGPFSLDVAWIKAWRDQVQ